MKYLLLTVFRQRLIKFASNISNLETYTDFLLLWNTHLLMKHGSKTDPETPTHSFDQLKLES